MFQQPLSRRLRPLVWLAVYLLPAFTIREPLIENDTGWHSAHGAMDPRTPTNSHDRSVHHGRRRSAVDRVQLVVRRFDGSALLIRGSDGHSRLASADERRDRGGTSRHGRAAASVDVGSTLHRRGFDDRADEHVLGRTAGVVDHPFHARYGRVDSPRAGRPAAWTLLAAAARIRALGEPAHPIRARAVSHRRRGTGVFNRFGTARLGDLPTGANGRQRLLLLGAFCASATLVNPYGIRLYEVVVNYGGNREIYELFPELRSLAFRSPADWAVLGMFAAAVFCLGKANQCDARRVHASGGDGVTCRFTRSTNFGSSS